MTQSVVAAMAMFMAFVVTSATMSVDLQGQARKRHSLIEIASTETAEGVSIPAVYGIPAVDRISDLLILELRKVKGVKQVSRAGSSAAPADASTLRVRLFLTQYRFVAEPATQGTGAGVVTLAGRVSFLESGSGVVLYEQDVTKSGSASGGTWTKAAPPDVLEDFAGQIARASFVKEVVSIAKKRFF